MKDAVFITRTAAQAQINTPTLMKENEGVKLLDEEMLPVERERAEITTRTTELSGAAPYMFGASAYLIENYKDNVKRDTEDFYIRIGSKNNPIPFRFIIDLSIGNHKDQKELFMQEFYRLLFESRPVWLPTGDGRMAFIPPFRFIPLTKKLEEIDIKKIKEYRNLGIDKIIDSVVIECYEPLFAGHFDGHKDGFIKQPRAFYATIRDIVMKMRGIDNADFDYLENDKKDDNGKTTAVNVYKAWIYLSIHDNDAGTEKNVKLIDLLKSVSPRLLLQKEKKFYIRNERLGVFTNMIRVLCLATKAREKDLDFIIDGLTGLDVYDWDYAERQGYPKGSDDVYSILYALKHHLKAHQNEFQLGIKRCLNLPKNKREKPV